MPAIDRCHVCGEEFGFALGRCTLCHHLVCENCAMRRGGMFFCGAGCAHAFFFGEEEEEDLPEVETDE